MASGSTSAIGGGNGNTASGAFSTVPGGWQNVADGDYSFAAGLRAQANHDGAFVWADSIDADFASTAANQFLVRAGGGVGIGTMSPTATLDVNGSTRTATLEITGGSPLEQELAAWGANDVGQIDVPTGTFTAVAGGTFHSLAIHGDGTLVGWGDNGLGQLDVPAGLGADRHSHTDRSAAPFARIASRFRRRNAGGINGGRSPGADHRPATRRLGDAGIDAVTRL